MDWVQTMLHHPITCYRIQIYFENSTVELYVLYVLNILVN